MKIRQRKIKKGGFIQAILPLAAATLGDLFSGSGIENQNISKMKRGSGMRAMGGRIRRMKGKRKGGFVLNLLKRAVPFVKKLFTKGKKFVKDNPEVVSLAKKGAAFAASKIADKLDNKPQQNSEETGSGLRKMKGKKKVCYYRKRKNALYIKKRRVYNRGRGIAPIPGPLP